MQIDFHHAAIYVLSRMAGFNPKDANIISYSSQYVDDTGTFKSSGARFVGYNAIFFQDYGAFEYINSSHSMPDPYNMVRLDQHKIWVPFHFLPGNTGNKFIDKVLCRKAWSPAQGWTNPLAHDMVDNVVKNDRGLYRLGITLHVLADTFAHQHFTGIWCNEDNYVKGITIVSPKNYPAPGIKLGDLFSMGHAQADVLPDLPFLHWKYRNYNNVEIIRNNPADFNDAVDIIFLNLQDYKHCYRPLDPSPSEIDVKHDRALINTKLSEIQDKKGQNREEKWLKAIEGGEFHCCRGEKPNYFTEGTPGSWWHDVTELCPYVDVRLHPEWYYQGYRVYNEKFLKSDYKLFHDALISHLYYVTKVLYRKYGICAL